MQNLNRDQALHCASVFHNYFGNYTRIDEYMRAQKLDFISDRQKPLPCMGPERDFFTDFSLHPNDMEFEILEPHPAWWASHIDVLSSHIIPPHMHGRQVKLSVIDCNTNKVFGLIKIGSPVINMKPRNQLLGGQFSSNDDSTKAFNNASMMGFVIVPAQPFGFNYLGGKLLAAICCSDWMKDFLDHRYGMNTCLFETTSLYGNTKTVSQYDGMKPYLKYGGLTDSKFIPMLQGKTYDDLRDYVEDITGELIPNDVSSQKLKIINKIVSMTKTALKGSQEQNWFEGIISNAMSLTEQKRYYYSDYGYSNALDVVRGKTDTLVPGPNYSKFELDNIYTWWKKKASHRYETLKADGRLRTQLEVWTQNQNIDIIR